jgi:hypothetical protein
MILETRCCGAPRPRVGLEAGDEQARGQRGPKTCSLAARYFRCSALTTAADSPS